MTYTRLNAEPATKKLKSYTNGWTTSITFYMPGAAQALVLFNGQRLYTIWSNPSDLILTPLIGTVSGISASRAGYPGNVTLSWSGNFAVSVLMIEP